jgi:CheY-like chemotaxis protein
VSDERRLKQVLVNLLNNAVKFTPEGGQIGIEVQGNPEHHHIAISIWDTGIGISEEDQKKLFQPFIQLDSSLSRRYAGMGLGLSLVINLVELLGGGLQLESKLTQGSRFTISLPWNDETQNDLPAASPGFPEQIHKTGHPDALLSLEGKIMLVDDNELTLMTLKDYLSSLGARVTLCRSGVEALEAIKETPPDILLVDIQLPDLDGLEIIRRLRSEVKTIRLPIIALTALAMAGDRERCLAAGANEYIAKPFSLQHLAAILRDHLYEAPTTDTNQPPDPYFG